MMMVTKFEWYRMSYCRGQRELQPTITQKNLQQ